MAEKSGLQLWSMRMLYAALCGFVMMFHLLPLGQIGAITFSPDIVLCITLAWVVRRPAYAPIVLIAAVVLLADLLMMRVPGLWAALCVLLADSTTRQRLKMRSTGFGVEWLRVSLGIAAIFALERIVLGVLLVETPPLGANIAQLAATIAVYPVVVAITSGVFRVRKPELIETTNARRRA